MASKINAKMRKAIKDSLENGNSYFSKECMEFWNCTVEAGMFDNNTFVTSEDTFDGSMVLYTARYYDWNTHEIITLGEFQQFASLEYAIEFAKSYRRA